MKTVEETVTVFLNAEFSKEMKGFLKAKTNQDKLIDYIVKTKAWNDAIIWKKFQRKNSGNNEVLENKEAICNILIEHIKELKNSPDYQEWHKVIVTSKLKKYMNTGIAQKFVNMTIKYFYFIEKENGFQLIDNVSFVKYENDLDVPLDSYILKWFLFNSKHKEYEDEDWGKITAWNNIIDDGLYYGFLQPQIKNKLREKVSQEVPILIAETMVWDDIKDISKAIQWKSFLN